MPGINVDFVAYPTSGRVSLSVQFYSIVTTGDPYDGGIDLSYNDGNGIDFLNDSGITLLSY
jgi:PKD repeat protein